MEVVLGMVLWPVSLEAPADGDLAARGQSRAGGCLSSAS